MPKIKKDLVKILGSKKAAKYFLKSRRAWDKYGKYNAKVKELINCQKENAKDN